MANIRLSKKGLDKALEAYRQKQIDKVKYNHQMIADNTVLLRSRVDNFFNGRYLRPENFKAICVELGLDWQEVAELQRSQQEISFNSYKQDQKEESCNCMFSSRHTHTFSYFIERKLERFVGRGYVVNAFKQFTEQNDRGYFTLMGEPGEGKSTIAARYAKKEDCLFYFNIRGNGQNTAAEFIESICLQLIERYSLDNYSSLPPNATQNNVFLQKLLSEASQKIGCDEKIVIVVDALDEVDLTPQSSSSNVLYLPQALPKGVYFFLTQRRDVEALKPRVVFDANQESISLEDFAESSHDIERYIRNYFNDPQYRDNLKIWRQKQGIDENELLAILKEKSVRNFLYISLVLPELANPNGIYKDALVKELPRGLTKHYDRHWELMGMNHEQYPVDKLRIICVICRSRTAIPCEFLAKRAGEEELKVELILKAWLQFLEQRQENDINCYRFYHKSYTDFVFSKPEVKKACGDPQETDKRIVENILPKNLSV